MQSQLLKGEIANSKITKNNCVSIKFIWEPYLKLDVLCLDFKYARRSLKMQKIRGSGIKTVSQRLVWGASAWELTKRIEKLMLSTINRSWIFFALR